MSNPGGTPPLRQGPLPPRMEDFRLRTSSEGSAFRGHDALPRGAKRVAVSPPQSVVDTELGPPPLSDDDLQDIKNVLSGHDYSFASINAVSKESSIKKKELEEVIAAYRGAVDRLTRAYIQVKAERDTTAKIWKMMRSGRGDGSERSAGAEMSDMIRESASVAVREVMEEWRFSAGISGTVTEVHGGGRSYAGAVAASGAGVSLFPPLSGRVEAGPGSGRAVETIEVVPRDRMDSRLPDSSAMCNAVLSSIRPGESGIRIDRLVKGKNKSVRIVAARDDLSKLKPMLDEIGMDVKHIDRLNPRLVIRDIPADIDKQHFLRDLVKQNLESTNEGDVKLVYWFPIKNRRNTSAIIEVSSEIRNRLMSQARVYLGWSSCRVADHVRVLQCYKCLNFGHIAKNCRAASDICGHCCGGHESRVCPNKNGVRKCHNCVNAGMSSVDHSALDVSACLILQRKLRDKSRLIKY